MGHWPGSVYLFREASKKIFLTNVKIRGVFLPFVKNGHFFALIFLTIQMCQNARELTLCYQYTLLDLILVCSTDTCWNAPALVTSARSLAAILGLESPSSVLGITSVYPRYILGVRSSSLQYQAVPLSYGSQQTTHSRCWSGVCRHIL